MGRDTRAARGAEHRLVSLTAKAWRVIEINLAAAQRIERDWTAALGKDGFTELTGALRRLGALEAATQER